MLPGRGAAPMDSTDAMTATAAMFTLRSTNSLRGAQQSTARQGRAKQGAEAEAENGDTGAEAQLQHARSALVWARSCATLATCVMILVCNQTVSGGHAAATASPTAAPNSLGLPQMHVANREPSGWDGWEAPAHLAGATSVSCHLAWHTRRAGTAGRTAGRVARTADAEGARRVDIILHLSVGCARGGQSGCGKGRGGGAVGAFGGAGCPWVGDRAAGSGARA